MNNMYQMPPAATAEKRDAAAATHRTMDTEGHPGALGWVGTNCPGCRYGVLFHEDEHADRADGWEVARCSRCNSRWQRYGNCPTCRRWTQLA